MDVYTEEPIAERRVSIESSEHDVSQGLRSSTNSISLASSVSSIEEMLHDPHEGLKLILFFDGTGNKFLGSSADTNVVKLLRKLDRSTPNQYHYYQSGIGTYDPLGSSRGGFWAGSVPHMLRTAVDLGTGATFDDHVIGGYRFLMKYYEKGAKIYMFGFSRGAYTARFLARMVNTVGLLCHGNEEMVPFALDLWKRHYAGTIKEAHERQGDPDLPAPPESASKIQVENFSRTFCQTEIQDGEEANVKVYFLGLWDCVGSVSMLDLQTPVPKPAHGTAKHVRHAVALDERRVKFRPSLFAQDLEDPKPDAQAQSGTKLEAPEAEEDIQEVWFPGNHGDVGGGWLMADTEVMQLSDISLAWMINEIDDLEKDKKCKLSWYQNTRPEPHREGVDYKNKDAFIKAYARPRMRDHAYTSQIHDILSYSLGEKGLSAWLKTTGWNIMEWLPIIRRLELTDNGEKWCIKHFPLNRGRYRSIPDNAVLHESVHYRLQNVRGYEPKNHHGNLVPCVKLDNLELRREEHAQGPAGPKLYQFRNRGLYRGGFVLPSFWTKLYANIAMGVMKSRPLIPIAALAYLANLRFGWWSSASLS